MFGCEASTQLVGECSSENRTPGQVSPVLTLSFVRESREKAKVGRTFLSENLFEGKLGEERCLLGAMIQLSSRNSKMLWERVIQKRSRHT
jgi:hypothetical protein